MKIKFRKFDQAGADGTATGGAPATTGGAESDSFSVNGSGQITGHGSVAQRLMQTNFNVQALRTQDTLRKDEWIQYDEAVVAVARARMPIVASLMEAGMSYGLNNALGTTVLQWEQASDMTDAEITMNGLSDSQRDRLTFTLQNLPVPITHKDFSLNIRNLEASRRTGQSLDTAQAELAGRLVSERIEKMLVQGASMPFGGGNIYGLTNHPSRNTGSLTSNWADSVNTTGEEIVNDVLKMMAALVADNMYGPYELYVPSDYYVRLSDDYKANSDRTIMERILSIPGIRKVLPSTFLGTGASGKVVLLQMTRDVADMVDGIQPTVVSWDSHGGMMMNFKVLSIMVPRMKADAEGRCGIAQFQV